MLPDTTTGPKYIGCVPFTLFCCALGRRLSACIWTTEILTIALWNLVAWFILIGLAVIKPAIAPLFTYGFLVEAAEHTQLGFVQEYLYWPSLCSPYRTSSLVLQHGHRKEAFPTQLRRYQSQSYSVEYCSLWSSPNLQEWLNLISLKLGNPSGC